MSRKHGFFRPHLGRGFPQVASTTLREGGGWWIPGSQLDLDFANNRAFNRSTGFNGSPNGILTYTSPSPKLVYGDDGVLRYAPHNLLTYSAQFDNAAWTKGSVTVTANTVASPDGTTTADKIVETAATSTHNASQTVTIVTATVYTHSVYAKAAERSWVCLEGGSGAGGYSVWFNLATGAVGTISGTTAGNVSIVALPNGWYRCVVTDTSAGTSGVYRHYVCNADNNQSYAGDGTSGIYLWGAQLNLGSSALTYTPTTTAAVYSLPIDHDPITHAPLGVLIEEQRTNLLTYSEQFDNAAWAKTRSTVTANAITAPNGTLTADKLIPSVDNNTHYISQTGVAISIATAYTMSVYAKAGEYNWIAITSENNVDYVSFDLTNGVVGTQSGATGTITDVGNGWYRITCTDTSLDTSGTFGVYVLNATAGFSFAGNASDGLYIWGAQAE